MSNGEFSLRKALRWNRANNFWTTCTPKIEQHSIRSLRDIVMLTIIDVEGLKLPIGLRNKLLNIIREYTVPRQGTKRGTEEKLLEMSEKHAKLGNVGNVSRTMKQP